MGRFGVVVTACLTIACLPGAAWAAPEPSEGASEAPRSDREIAEGLFSSTRRLTAPRKRDPDCGQTNARGEIVVCGADRGERWRVPSTTSSDPASRAAQDTGIARAPNVSALPDCSRGCIHLGRKVPQVLTVDLSKLPPPPAGSDADRIGRGEMAEH